MWLQGLQGQLLELRGTWLRQTRQMQTQERLRLAECQLEPGAPQLVEPELVGQLVGPEAPQAPQAPQLVSPEAPQLVEPDLVGQLV